jgi:urease accessory protein
MTFLDPRKFAMLPAESKPSHLVSLARVALVAASAGLLPTLASAHLGVDAGMHHEGISAVAMGFAHPFTGIDHLMAMIGLGLWSATSARRVWAAPLAFAAMLVVGALLGRSGVALPAVEPMIAASLLVIGLLAATRAQLPTAAGVAIAAVFALFHGAAHGQEFGGAAGAEVLGGMVAATMLLHAAGIVLGRALQARATWLPRAAGAIVAACGLGLLALPLAA